ncbi:MAG TPA: RNA 2'-phosphotransferase [Ktedonobacteraceae bacterium]|jgi:putative RNA 2'-phosphotransferase
MKQSLVQLSRTLAYALRHDPASFGLQLDAEGWVDVQDVLHALSQRRSAWSQLCEEDIVALMAQSDKQRFELRDGRIRAYYGHSFAQKILHTPDSPPTFLFHGTTPQAYEHIRQQGLLPMERQYVHLSAEKKTALQVARRRTTSPALLKIAAQQAAQQGIHFYLGNDMVWLADKIPPHLISIEQTE